MVNLETGKMSIDGVTWLTIESWNTWFLTPFGAVSNLAQAVKACKGRDLDPDLTIVPVPVAVSGQLVEIVRR